MAAPATPVPARPPTAPISNLPPVVCRGWSIFRLPSPAAPSLHPRITVRSPRLSSPRRLLMASAKGNGLNPGGGDGPSPPQLPRSIRWRDLLSPNPENLAAVGLTGLLTWASVQVLFQLFFISISILLAGLKYSFVAALLLFLLITLL